MIKILSLSVNICYNATRNMQEVHIMGFYLNPGNKGFWESIRSKIYVDKTGLIAYINGLINTKENLSVSADPGGSESR